MTDTVHVVRRLNWARHGTGYIEHDGLERLIRLPGTVRLATFDDEADALAECARREEKARRGVNPFTCNGDDLSYQTSFDADRLHDWLLDADVQPPEAVAGRRDWLGWWERVKSSLGELQGRHVWHALDRVTFHEVVELPRRPVVYLVAQIGWSYNDNGYDPPPEGSVPIRAYRDRNRAEAERARREARSRAEYRYLNGFDLSERQRRAEPFGTETLQGRPNVDDPAYPLFFEVVEVELSQLTGRSP